MASTTSPAPGSGNYIDFGRAFQFFFEDPEWVKKILLGGAFQLAASLLIGLPFVAGYAMELTRRAARAEPRPLPEWNDLGALFGDGLRAVGLYLVLLLPAVLVFGGIGCMFALLTGALGSSRRASDAAGVLAALGIPLLYLLLFLVMFALLLYFPAAYLRMTLLNRFSAGLEFRENVDLIRRNLGNYALALVLYLLTSFLSQFGLILCCIGFFPAAFWSVCVTAWALGELARRDPLIGAAAAPVLPSY